MPLFCLFIIHYLQFTLVFVFVYTGYSLFRPIVNVVLYL